MRVNTDVRGKRVLLLGACGVLGRAHARALVEHEAQLIVADRPGSTVLDDAKALGIPGIEVDIAQEFAIINGIARAAELFGGLDGAIFNAAVTSEGLVAGGGNAFPAFEDYPLALWQKAIDINLTGAFLFAREVGKVLKDAKRGSLINIASIYGVVGPDHSIYDGQLLRSFPAYSASKAGIIGLTRWLATWWAKDGIRVNCVSPGGVYNGHDERFTTAYGNRTPMGRMAKREEITGILIYLLSDSSSYCTGQNLIIDGGFTSW
ncbi:MAG: SDR family oxidoreductase [Betaproteobacteria bacterium]|nr:SDR family oxidoreductase [Betaproteobacteria bacterium]